LLHPAKGQKISGEYSASYLLNPLVSPRVAARLPDTKIIVLLRNPIDRAYSHFIMYQREGMEPYRSFDEIVRREIEEVPALLEAHQRGFLEPGNKISAHRSTPDGVPISVAEHNKNWTLHPRTMDNAPLHRQNAAQLSVRRAIGSRAIHGFATATASGPIIHKLCLAASSQS
jgi:hypothetical protein